MSGALSYYELHLCKKYVQSGKITHQRGKCQNQPKAGLEAKVKESALHHYFRVFFHYYLSVFPAVIRLTIYRRLQVENSNDEK